MRLGLRVFGVVAAFMFLSGCEGRKRVASGAASKPAPGDDRLVVFDVSSPLPETLTSGGFFPRPAHHTFGGFLSTIRRAKENDHVKGALLRLGGASHGWAQVEELGRAFGAFRETGRTIFCHADGLDNRSMLLAAASCDQIWLSPAGSVESVGIAGQTVYLKGLLDRFKIRAEFLHAGRYKSAAESLTRDGPSPEAEESLRFVLASLRDTWLDGIERSRSDPQARDAVESGPWHPQAARSIGLIDHVGYESDARDALEKDVGVEGFVAASGAHAEEESASQLAEVLRALAGGAASFEQPHVAVLAAAGGIAMSSDSAFEEVGISARGLTKVIRGLKRDDAVKAVVLRIDSPGGSALASDLLWHELRRLNDEKPLIASVGSMAASGGYYMAAAARTIVAERSSIVGSIGVFGGKFVLDEALAQYGVSAHIFSAKDEPDAGVRAAYLSPFVAWDDEVRERVRGQMESIYALFLDRVATGRGVSVEEVRKVAEGRIWTGVQGHERGLVDELGGLRNAIEMARDVASLPKDAPFTIEGDVETLLDLLGLGDEADEGEVRAAWRKRFHGAEPLWTEVDAAQRSYLQSLTPLLHGETSVVALPYALSVK